MLACLFLTKTKGLRVLKGRGTTRWTFVGRPYLGSILKVKEKNCWKSTHSFEEFQVSLQNYAGKVKEKIPKKRFICYKNSNYYFAIVRITVFHTYFSRNDWPEPPEWQKNGPQGSNLKSLWRAYSGVFWK